MDDSIAELRDDAYPTPINNSRPREPPDCDQTEALTHLNAMPLGIRAFAISSAVRSPLAAFRCKDGRTAFWDLRDTRTAASGCTITRLKVRNADRFGAPLLVHASFSRTQQPVMQRCDDRVRLRRANQTSPRSTRPSATAIAVLG